MDLERRKVAMRFFAIFFFVVGIGLLIFIGNLVYSSYRTSIKDVNSTKESEDTVSCNQIYLDISVTSAGNLLIKNNVISSLNLDEMTLVDYATGSTTKKSYTFFKPGMQRELDASDISFETVYIYPYSCDSVWHICNMTAKTCDDADSYFADS